MLADSREITWVAIDPGDSRLNPRHIESVIVAVAAGRGIPITALTSHQIVDVDSRMGFSIGVNAPHELVESFVLDIKERINAPQHSPHESKLLEYLEANTDSRYIIFPSEIEIFDKHTSDEILEKTAIESVIAIGEELPHGAIIDTSNYLRPVMYKGKLTLFVERLYTDEFAPIEKENPHQCCGGDHAPY